MSLRPTLPRAATAALTALAVLASPGARADENDAWDGDYDVPSTRRSDLAVGLVFAPFVGLASGYPNDITKLDDPEHRSTTGFGFGGAVTLWAGGAIRDWFTLGLGVGGEQLNGPMVSATSGVIFFHIDSYPLYALGGEYENVGLTTDFGLAFAKLKGDAGELASSGSGSSIAAGVFWEGLRWGNHVSAGPGLLYQVQFSDSLMQNAGMLALRVTLYGGPGASAAPLPGSNLAASAR